MSIYTVTVKTDKGRFGYTAIALSSSDVVASVIDQFGICAVTVKPI